MSRNMVDSGVEWIGKIPEGWNLRRLKFCCKVTTGNLDTQDADPNGEYPFYVRSPIVERSSNPSFEGEGILMAGDGAGAGRIFHHAYGIYAVHQRVYRMYDFCIDANFLYWYLQSIFPMVMDGGSAQSTVPSVRLPMLLNLPICCTSSEELCRITSCLSQKITAIDDVLVKTQESIEEYKKLKQAVITEAVTKGVRGKRPMKDSGIDCIGCIPDTWQCCKIRYLHKGLTDGTHGTYNRTDNGRLLLSSKNVRENALEIGDNESYISEEDYQSIVACGFPQRNDVLMCCIGASIGRCIIYDYDEPMAFQRSVIFIRSNAHYTPRMLRYSLLSNATAVQEQFLINQSAQAGLYQGSVAEIYVTVPSLDEQQEIADYLDKKCAAIDTLISKKQQFIEELTAYKKSLIYEYVTGKKEVPA